MASFYSDPKKLDGPFHKLLEALPDMTGKTVAVTGCTSGTGLVFAKVAAKKGAVVICLNRPSARADAALKELQDGGAKATHVDCDLTSLSSVKAAIAPVKAALPDGGLDVLCCNAGIMHVKDIPTEDKLDPQMQVNQISHFLLVSELWDALSKAAELRGDARVCMHSSAARNIDGRVGLSFGPCWPTYCTKRLDPRFFEKHEAGGLGGEGCPCMLMFQGKTMTRYQQSKLANFTFAYALADKITASGSKIKATAAHPGVAKTALLTNGTIKSGYLPECMAPIMSCVLMQSTEMGTLGIIRGSLASDTNNGDFFGPGWPCYPITFWGAAYKRTPESWSVQEVYKEMVWKKCEEATGVTFNVMDRK